MPRPRLVFMGTSDFARVILESLCENGPCEVVAACAQPDRPAGRGMPVAPKPVALFAREKNIALFQPENLQDESTLRQLKSLDPDFIAVAAYGIILPPAVLSAARREVLNVHASLLPKYRGAAPVAHALLNDETETGVTIMRVIRQLDAGPVFAARKTVISDEDDAESLAKRLASLGATLLNETLRRLIEEKVEPVEQDHGGASWAPKLTRALCPVDWSRPARGVFNRVRALVPWPVAETALGQKRIRLFRVRALDEPARRPAGTIVHIGRAGWTVAAGDRNVLVTDVQIPGRKRQGAFEAGNGLRIKVGDVLG